MVATSGGFSSGHPGSVADPAIFVEKCLFKGIGPAKGFGCGLMLVKRI